MCPEIFYPELLCPLLFCAVVLFCDPWPVVLCGAVLQMMLSNRVIKTFEVSVEQFHQLRFGVAKVSF